MSKFRSIAAQYSPYSAKSIKLFLLGLISSFLLLSVWHFNISSNILITPFNVENFTSNGAPYQTPARILCAVFSNPTNLLEKAVAVNNTWGRRCDTLLFVSEKSHPGLPMLLVNVSTGRPFLSVKHRIAFDLIYRDYLNKSEWFFKADDDTYIIMENLQRYLKDKNPAEPANYGHLFQAGPRRWFITGGSGYVMSREALRRLGERKEGVYSNQMTFADDLLLGDAMTKLGVKQVNALDSKGLQQFHFLKFYDYITGTYDKWYRDYEKRPLLKGVHSLTGRPITFHYVAPLQMYELEYYLYRVRPVQ